MAVFEGCEAAGRNAVTHCSGGCHRTGLVLTAWLAHRYGLPHAAAAAEMEAFAAAAHVDRNSPAAARFEQFAYPEGDVRSLSAAELLMGQGSSMVVFHPGNRTLYLGLGSDAAPIGVPHCLAHWRAPPPAADAAAGAAASPASASAAAAAAHYSGRAPGAAALHDAARFLQLQLPPPGARGAGAAAGGGAAGSGGAGYKERVLPEGEDSFMWAATELPPLAAAPAPRQPAAGGGEAGQEQPSAGAAAEGGGEQGQQEGAATKQQQQQQQQEEGKEGAGEGQEQRPPAPAASAAQAELPRGRRYRGRFIGNEVLLIPPDAPYTTVWPLEGGRIAGLLPSGGGGGQLPDHLILDRLEEIWRWGLSRLGLGEAAWRALDAVLVVPHGMTAREVRLLADLLLSRLGFRALAAHLEPACAAFGAGASAACVVDVAPEGTTITCVEEGILLGDGGAARLAAGADSVTRSLLGLLRAHGAWPEPLATLGSGGGAGGKLGGSCGGYELELLTRLRDARCYCVKASTDPGLVGAALLEDDGPAELPLRAPGAPTRLFSFPTSPWDCIAPLALLWPALDPACGGGGGGGPLSPRKEAAAGSGAAAAAGGGGAGAAGEEQQAEEQAGARPVVALRAGGGGGGEGQQEARGRGGAAGGDAMDVDGAPPPPPVGAPAGKRPRAGPPPMVDDTPAAERLFLAGQFKSYQQQQEEWQAAAAARKRRAAAAAAAGGEGGGGEGGEGEGAALPAPPVSAYLLGPCEAEPPPEKLPLDQAIVRCIDAAAAGRAELRQRLLAGILLTGDAGGTRGLMGLLERRVGAITAAMPLQGAGIAAVQPPMVNVLEPRGDPRHTAWRGAALLACLDSTSAGRDGWLARRQWDAGADGGAGGGGPGRAAAAVNRHARLFSYLRSQQGA
ncbi:MAG: hypothetical protein J3K34DRAFT_523922 [Monoraphidium minutum]|nr:MAG: hypothetical protein J3K34DRAFT_523922 [Monoraphidium minutum]